MKKCNSCGELKNEDEFNWRYKALGIRHPTCKECQKGFRRNWYEGSAKEKHKENVHARKRIVREEAREFVYQYLSEHPCSQCGESDPVALEFHHVEGKDRAVSELVAGGYSVDRIKQELARCIVLCATCHRKVTAKELGWYRGRR
jgi:5-methylcytosine-specific restriction endonuclease McrA